MCWLVSLFTWRMSWFDKALNVFNCFLGTEGDDGDQIFFLFTTRSEQCICEAYG